MKKLSYLLLAVCIVSCFAGNVFAGSIWAKRSKEAKSFYADDTARKVGDVITIVISETTAVDSKVSRDLEKKTAREHNWNGQIGLKTPNNPILPRIPGFTVDNGTGSSNTLNGKADYKDQRTIEDRITAIVEDVQPNGNLVLIGHLKRNVAGDIQAIRVGGVVRPSDITFNNTIQSSQIAEFYVVFDNDGVSETYNKVGWFGKILDFIWPL